MSENRPESANRSYAIDLLRGFAVLAVMTTHLPFSMLGIDGAAESATVYPGAWFTTFSAYGKYGVHLFLVISGFCIHLRWARKAELDQTIGFLGFWRRRLTRLYPPYLVVLACSLLAIFGLYSVLGTPSESHVGAMFGYADTSSFAIDVVLLVLMLQNFNNASHHVGNGPLWSLALEEQLYLLYFPLLRMRRLYGWRTVLSVTFFVTIGWRVLGFFVPWVDDGLEWFVLGPAFWFPWALGAYAVEAYLGHVTPPRWVLHPGFLVVLATGALVCDPPAFVDFRIEGASQLLGAVLFAMIGFWLVLKLTLRERTHPIRLTLPVRALLTVGAMSYSLYLTHNPIYVVTKRLALSLGAPPLLALILRVSAAFLGAYVVYRVFEIPAVRRARKVVVPMRDVPPPVEYPTP